MGFRGIGGTPEEHLRIRGNVVKTSIPRRRTSRSFKGQYLDLSRKFLFSLYGGLDCEHPKTYKVEHGPRESGMLVLWRHHCRLNDMLCTGTALSYAGLRSLLIISPCSQSPTFVSRQQKVVETCDGRRCMYLSSNKVPHETHTVTLLVLLA